MNDLIVKRIREARLERNLTQSDLAEYLGKSTASISELERGKVQVTASDLYKIAQYLNKPIEFFYDEEIGDQEIQDLVAVLRKQPAEVRDQSIRTTNLLLQMQQITDAIDSNPDKNLPIEEVGKFLYPFLQLKKMLNQMNEQINELSNKIALALKEQGIDFPSS